MTFLLLSILCSTLIYAVFKLLKTYDINSFHAIVVNYFVAAGFGMIYASANGASALPSADSPWLAIGLITGCSLILIFYLMAITSQKMGVSTASVATKMSLIIPAVFFVLVDPLEQFSTLKVLGITSGLISVWMMTASGQKSEIGKRWIWLPLMVFLGSGIIDILFATAERDYLDSPEAFLTFTPFPFLISGFLGILTIGFQIVKRGVQFKSKALIGGLALGLVNYGSIFFLLKALNADILHRSDTIPVNNMGVVALSTVMGILFFKEKPNWKRNLGIVLAIAAIALLMIDTHAP